MVKRRREAWAKWRGLIAEQQRGGQSVAAFCRERGLCAPQFFGSKKHLSQAASGEFVAVQVLGEEEPVPAPVASPRTIEIRGHRGWSVWVEPGFDAAHLGAVLAALERRA